MFTSERTALVAAHTAQMSTVKTVKKNAVQTVNTEVVQLKSAVRDLAKKLTLCDDELMGLTASYNSVSVAHDKLGETIEASAATIRNQKEEIKALTALNRSLKLENEKKGDLMAESRARAAEATLAIEKIRLEKAKVNKDKKLEAQALDHVHKVDLVERKANLSVHLHGSKQSTNKKVHKEKMVMATNRLTELSAIHHNNNGMFPSPAAGAHTLNEGPTPVDLGTKDIKSVSQKLKFVVVVVCFVVILF